MEGGSDPRGKPLDSDLKSHQVTTRETLAVVPRMDGQKYGGVGLARITSYKSTTTPNPTE